MEEVYIQNGCWWPRFTPYDQESELPIVTGSHCYVLLGDLVGDKPRSLFCWITFGLTMPFVAFAVYKLNDIRKNTKDWFTSVPFGLWLRLLVLNVFASLLFLDYFQATELYPKAVAVILWWVTYFMIFNIIIYGAYQMWHKMLSEIHKSISSKYKPLYGYLLNAQVLLATLIHALPSKSGTFRGSQWLILAFEALLLGSLNFGFAFGVYNEIRKSQREIQEYRGGKKVAGATPYEGSLPTADSGFSSQIRKLTFHLALEIVLVLVAAGIYINRGIDMIRKDQSDDFQDMFETKSSLVTEY